MKSNQQIIRKSFPKNIGTISFSMLESSKENAFNMSEDGISFVLESEELVLPYRIYCEPYLLVYSRNQSVEKRIVAFCLLTRHHNGYIREKYLKKVITSTKKWVIPFIVQLLGEYVVEILIVIWENIDAINKENLVSFITENKNYWTKTKARIASYYGEYYRFKINQSDYVGFKLTRRIEQLIREENRLKPKRYESTDTK